MWKSRYAVANEWVCLNINMRAPDKEIDKYYYDACSLDSRCEIYGEILSKHPRETIISHLAIGEAYGNCLGDGREKSEHPRNLCESRLS